MSTPSYDRIRRLEEALVIAARVGNSFLAANLRKAIEEAKKGEY